MRWLSTLSNLHQASDDDSDESDDFGVSEEVLDPGAPFHISTVHKRQQTCLVTKSRHKVTLINTYHLLTQVRTEIKQFYSDSE